MRILIALFFCFIAMCVNAQDAIDEHHHDHHKTEIGVANAPVYFIGENSWNYGLHIHLLRTIGHSDFAIGVGYERIFDPHGHNTLGIVISYRPIERLSLNIAPGFTSEDSDLLKTNFAIHFESSYEFQLGDFHIGPVAEIAYDPEDIHISLGLHLGIGF